ELWVESTRNGPLPSCSPTRESSRSSAPVRATVNHDCSGDRPSRFSRSRNCSRPIAFMGSFPSQDQDLLLEELLHSVLGHVELGDGHLEPIGGIGPREALDGRELERLPVPRLDPLLDPAHGQLEQLAVERPLEAAPRSAMAFCHSASNSTCLFTRLSSRRLARAKSVRA